MEKYLERLDEMIKYVTSKSKCRASMLLDYFGQESVRCGMCDVCMSRNELDMSKYEFDQILDEIKVILQNEEMTTDKLLSELDAEKDEAIKVIRWLLDHDKILKDNNENLIWNN